MALRSNIYRMCKPNFQSAVLNLVAERSISFIIPAHDDVALAFSEMEMPDTCMVIGQSHSTNLSTRYKSATYKSLHGVVPVPETFVDPDRVQYPVFVKPDRGQGSKHAELLKNTSDMERFLKVNDPNDFVFCEHRPGEEFTIDCFSSEGMLRFAGPRLVRGQSMVSPRCLELWNPIHCGMNSWIWQQKSASTLECMVCGFFRLRLIATVICVYLKWPRVSRER